MRNLRLYVDTNQQPRPTPPPPFSSGALTPRLVLCGRSARLASPRERFAESPRETAAAAASSTSARNLQSAATAAERLEESRKLRYKLDTTGSSSSAAAAPVAPAAATTPRPPTASSSSSSPRRPASAVTHKTTSSNTIRLPLTSRVLKSKDKYTQLHEQRDAAVQKLNNAQSARRSASSNSPAAAITSASANFAQEANWYSRFCPDPSAVTYTQGTLRQQHEAREALRQQQREEGRTREASKFYAYAFFGQHRERSPPAHSHQVYGTARPQSASMQSAGGGAGDAKIGAGEAEQEQHQLLLLEHRALSPAPSAAAAHNVSESRDPHLLNAEQRGRVVQPEPSEEVTISYRRQSSRSKSPPARSKSPQQQQQQQASSSSPPVSASRPASASAATATTLFQLQKEQKAQLDADPVLRRSRHLLAEALRTAQDNKRSRHIFSQLHSVSSRAVQKSMRRSRNLMVQGGEGGDGGFGEYEAEEDDFMTQQQQNSNGLVNTPTRRGGSGSSKKSRSNRQFMIGVDQGGGPTVVEALSVSGAHLDAPGPRRPNSARETSSSSALFDESIPHSHRHQHHGEDVLPPAPPSFGQQQDDDATICSPPDQVPQAYVGSVPGVFAAGLLPTRRRDLHSWNVAETSAHKPLRLVEEGSVPVPGEFSAVVPRGRSDRWQTRK